MRLFIFLAMLVCLLTAAPSYAATDATTDEGAREWQTFETANFRVHFTTPHKTWAISAAHTLENSRQLLNEQQGRVLDEKVDAYIIDPFNRANGFAIPLSNKPMMALFTTPPQSDSVISNTDSWQQLLILHEYVHLLHLAQKNRSGWRQSLTNWWDLYDAYKINGNRWVNEGYATLLESKLTGRGRLFNDQVESILQQFAREGALPTYGQLSSNDRRYMSGSMAYLVGARFLHWLEKNYGEQSLNDVWTRWVAVKQRSFEEAFVGVFLDSPDKLYRRFVAQYTAQAMQKEQTYSVDPASLWLDTQYSAHSMTFSPNGEMLALIEFNNKRKLHLNVYLTKDNEKAQQKFKESMVQLLEDDPLDVADKMPKLFKRKIKYALTPTNYAGIENIRWVDDNHILFTAFSTDALGDKHQDLFSWQLSTNKRVQLTSLQNLRRFDISHDGKTIIAERNRLGYSQLVSLNSDGSNIKPLTESSLNVIYDFPRLNPQHHSLAYLKTSLNKQWQLIIKNLDDDSEQVVPMPSGYQFLSYPTWHASGDIIYYVAGLDDELRLYSFDFKSNQLTKITQGNKPISWPTLHQDQLLYLSITSQGPDVYQLDLSKYNGETVADVTFSASVDRQLRSKHQMPQAKINTDSSIGQLSSYGVGPQQGTFAFSATTNNASTDLLELSYKQSDILQHFGLQLNAATGDALKGVSGGVRWQGWPVKLLAQAYDFTLKTDQQSELRLAQQFNQQQPLAELSESGAMLGLSYPMLFDTLSFTPRLRYRINNDSKADNQYLSLGFKQAWFYERQSWGISQQAALSWLDGKRDNEKWRGSNAHFQLRSHWGDYAIGLSYGAAKRSGEATNLLNVGGFQSTLLQSKANGNRIFASHMPFYQLNGNDYQASEIFMQIEGWPTFFVARHQMNSDLHVAKDTIDLIGLKELLPINVQITGVNDLVLSYSITKEKDKSLNYSLGFSYQW
ncbi:MAG: hypothetical protein HRU25_06335 [Psychrobium sp.]|nr:hypothetical protein [Psychrobium sp.]